MATEQTRFSDSAESLQRSAVVSTSSRPNLKPRQPVDTTALRFAGDSEDSEPAPNHTVSGREWRALALGFAVMGCLLVVWKSFLARDVVKVAAAGPREQTASSQPVASPETTEAPNPVPHSPQVSAISDPDTAKLVVELLDPSVPLKQRRERARALARLGTDQAMAALRAALQDGPPYLKAAIGEGLGESPHPESMPLMLDLVHDADQTAARGAIRGLAFRGDAGSAEALHNALFDERMPESVRSEAALALGDVNQPAALESLTEAATQWHDGPLAESALEGLGKRPFSETEDFFRSYLQTPGLSADAKVAAIEALANSSTEAAPFLLSLAGDSDPDVRAAAAWSLIGTGGDTDLSASLVSLLQSEPDATVRSRLYQALANQDALDGSVVLALAEKETAPEARLEALALLAAASRAAPSAEMLAYFNQTAVPELKQAALTDQSSQYRLSSVTALARATTAESTAALTDISHQSTDPRVLEAVQAALSHLPNVASSNSP
jgi:HEAT repeat protein